MSACLAAWAWARFFIFFYICFNLFHIDHDFFFLFVSYFVGGWPAGCPANQCAGSPAAQLPGPGHIWSCLFIIEIVSHIF